jgi:hypothetical protein
LPEDCFFDQIHDILLHNGVIESFATVIQDDATPEKVVVAAVTLLWRFLVAPENPDADFAESTTIDGLLSAIIGAMYNLSSEALHEATCGLLSSIEIPLGSADSESISWKQTLSDAIWSSLTRHTTVEAVQLAGLRALFNLFCDRDESVADLERIVEAVIFAMNSFLMDAKYLLVFAKAEICIRPPSQAQGGSQPYPMLSAPMLSMAITAPNDSRLSTG